MAARRERGLFEPDVRGRSLFDHYVYTIDRRRLPAGGRLLRGVVTRRDCGLNLVLIYDDNRITIEGETDISFTEDVEARYAYGYTCSTSTGRTAAPSTARTSRRSTTPSRPPRPSPTSPASSS